MIRVQKLSPIATFAKAHPSDAGYDLTCCSLFYDKSSRLIIAHFGIKVELSKLSWALVTLRSSTAIRGWRLANSVGVVDTDFRGEWRALLECHSAFSDEALEDVARKELEGKRIAQAIVIPTVTRQFEVFFVDSLSETERGERGFGSTGR